MKKVLKKVGSLALVVIHDKAIDRAGKSLAVLVAVRVLIALGAAPTVIDLVSKL
jgi:hypothetical protein